MIMINQMAKANENGSANQIELAYSYLFMDLNRFLHQHHFSGGPFKWFKFLMLP